MIHISRKKKPSRKYTPRHEFRYNNSPRAKGHPHYVFGETKDKYKSLGLTHSPKASVRHVELKKNPNPADGTEAYLQLKVHTANKKYYGDTLQGWRFSNEDMSVVRHQKKKYKKAYNRKPPMYYENKKAQKKK